MIGLAAPAKLNLHLRVLGRRADGYHEIESLFVRLDLRDDVEIESGPPGLRFEATGEFEVPSGDENLCVAAARLFYDRIGAEPGVDIRLVKRIPVAAGLGGGSSDAASVLHGLNELSGRPLEAGALADLGARIGSDVPFFLLEDSFALVRGRGEVVLALPALPRRPVVIVVPDFGVSARDAYAWFGEAAGDGCGHEAPEGLAIGDELSEWGPIAAQSSNELQAGVFSRHPMLAVAKRALADTGAFMALLCGSGSCVAGVYDDPAALDRSLERLRSHRAILPGWRLVPTWTEGPVD
jgi:4-diphosphocytidyl-2-C-methyl-D-erythritol kinase